MAKLPSKPLVLVTWLDANALAPTTTVDDDDIDELLHKDCPIHTVGWLLKENANGVSIGSEWIEQDQNYRNTTYIPRALVKTIQRLARGRTPRPPLTVAPQV